MNKEISEALKVWAGVPSWHTGHSRDERRLHQSIRQIYEQVWTNISKREFKETLRQVVITTPPSLSGNGTDDDFHQYIKKSMVILEFLRYEGDNIRGV
ncbi:MAG: hypothetical protein ACTFAL_02985 [Candidatus Electronema sp. V4]|uniref:hypothetical protein n=1 Tax=Candidatus Electronema sp. V4 TaxID=3454756 RepID=UPI00405550ED